MAQYENVNTTPGEQQTGLTTEESYDNIDPNSPNYQGTPKKGGIFGKLKDKGKNVGTKIKAKVGKKKNGDGDSPTGMGAGDEEEEEYSGQDSLSPSGTQTTPYSGGESTPSGMSGLSLGDSKAAGDAPEQPRYGTEKASEAASGVAGRAQEAGGQFGDQARDTAYKTKDGVQAKAADVNNATGDSQTYTEKATGAATVAKDTAAEKLGVNQEPGAPSAVDQAKDYATSAVETAKEKTGMNQPSQGPSLVDKAKDYLGVGNEQARAATDTSKEQARAATDTSKEQVAAATDTAKSGAQQATDTTKDYMTQARDAVSGATTPNDDHKALSEKITDTLGNLTAPANSQTTASGDQASPGVLGKLTGMLGYGQKPPEAQQAKTAGADSSMAAPATSTE